MSPYFVTVRRRGVAPLTVTMLVRADDPDAAAGLASVLAERDRGGMFEAERVRPAPRRVSESQAFAYDDS
jgi:hypothetical protein